MMFMWGAAPTGTFSEDFEGGASGATITTTNTGFAAVVGTAAVFDNTQFVLGSQSARFPGGSTQSVQESFTATSVRYFRRYFRMTGLPSATTIISHARSGTTARAQMRVMITTGKLQLRNGLIADGADSTTSLVADTWYRLEWKLDATAQTQTLRIFHGANLHGTTPDEEMVRLFDTGTFDNIIDGQITSATWVTYEDAFASDPSDWPGPIAAAPQDLAPAGIASGEARGTPTVSKPTDSLRDAFDTLDTGRWVVMGSTTANGTLHVPCTSSYPGVMSLDIYRLTDSQIHVESLGTPTGATTQTFMRAYLDSDNETLIGKMGTSLLCSIKTAGVSDEASIAFSPTTHRWWRIRETSGTTYIESSPDGHAWTTRKSATTPAWVAGAGRVGLRSGYWGTETDPGEGEFDNLNILAPTAPAGIASGEAFGTANVSRPVHTLVEEFDTLDSARWMSWGGAAVSDGALHVPCTTSYPGINSNGLYSLRESWMHVQTLDWPTGASTSMAFRFVKDDDNQIGIGKFGTSLGMRICLAGVWDETYIAFDSAAHAWWRIRVTGGTVYQSTSPDGHTWTDRKQTTAPAWIDAGQLFMISGHWDTEADPGEAVFDNLNVYVPLAVTGIVTGETFGGPAVMPSITLSPTGIATAEAFGSSVAAWSRAENTFEGGTAGATITIGGTGSGAAWDATSIDATGTATWDATRAAHGFLSGRFVTTSSDVAYVMWTSVVSAPTVYARIYLYVDAYPPGNTNFLRLLSGASTIVGTVRIASTGKIGYFTGGTFVSATSASVTLGRWVRIEVRYTASTTAGSATIRLYDNVDPDSTTLTEELSSTGVNTASDANIDRLRAGIVASATVPDGLWIDDVAWSDVGWLGPATGAKVLIPSAVTSAEAVGGAVLTVAGAAVSPTDIASAEAFGAGTITTGPVTVTPGAAASAEAFGTAALTPGAVSISPTVGGAAAPIEGALVVSGARSTNVQSLSGTTASFSPPADSFLLLVVSYDDYDDSGQVVVSEITGLGLDWTPVWYYDGAAGGAVVHSFWAATGAAPGSGQLTITLSQVPSFGTPPVLYGVVGFTGTATGSPIAQTAEGPGAGITLAAAADPDNRPVAIWCSNSGSSARTNWTVLYSHNMDQLSAHVSVHWRADAFETTASSEPDYTQGIAFELAATVGAVPGGIPTAEAFGGSTLTTGAGTVAAAGVGTEEAHGTAAITTGAVTVAAAGLATAEAFGTPTVTPLWSITAAAVATGEIHGTAVIGVGPVTATPEGIPTAEAFSEPTLAVAEVTITPAGIGPGGFGNATLTTGLVTLSPASAASAEALGVVAVARPIAELADEFTGPDIDLTRWVLVGV
jgi:hypothetical protein